MMLPTIASQFSVLGLSSCGHTCWETSTWCTSDGKSISASGFDGANTSFGKPHSCEVPPLAKQSRILSPRGIPRTSIRSVPVPAILSHHIGARFKTYSVLSSRVPGVTTRSRSFSCSHSTRLSLHVSHIVSGCCSSIPKSHRDLVTTSTSQSYFRARALKAPSKCPACDPPARTMVAVGLSGAFSSSQTIILARLGPVPCFLCHFLFVYFAI